MLALALAPRLWGVGWQLPSALYFDELKYVEWAGSMAAGRATETDFRNPSLYRHLLHFEYRAAALIMPSRDERATALLQFLLARTTSGLLGALACVLTGLAAAHLASSRSRPWDGPLAGIVAGVLLGWSLLHVHMSHYAVNDAVASCALAGGLLFGARAIRAPTFWAFALAGLCAGLAASTKYNYGVVVAVPLAAACVALLRRDEPWHDESWRDRLQRDEPRHNLLLFGRRIALTVLGTVVGVLIGMPEVLWAAPALLAGMADQADIGTRRWNGQVETPVGLLYVQALERGIGTSVLALALLGGVVYGRHRPWALAALVSAPLLYLLVMLRTELFFARFAIPLLPFLVVLAALGIGWIARQPFRPIIRGALAAGALAFALVPQAGAVLRHDRLATLPDTRVLAHEWLETHASGDRVATETYGLPLNWAGKPPARYRLQRYGSLADVPTIEKLACDGVRYALLASITYERKQAWRGGQAAGYAELVRVARPVMTFDPFATPDGAAAHIDDTGLPFWNLDAYARPGPRIEVYEFSEDAARAYCASPTPAAALPDARG